MKSIAIVTGASSGVGQAFVRQFDEGRGGPLDEIWAIARDAKRLEDLANSCHGVGVRPISLDLTTNQAFDELTSMLEGEDATVQWLVNSAGYGKFGTFSEVGRAQNAGMVALNCLGVVNALSVALPHMVPGSCVVNLASIAGAVPQPELATYSATKAFVLELSRMLNHELAPCGIHVVAVCPKFMRTRFLSDPGNDTVANRMTMIGYNDVDDVVRKAMRCAIRGKDVCIPSIDVRLAITAANVLPRKVLFRIEDLLFRS